MALDHAKLSVIAVYNLSSETVKTAWPVTASTRLPFTTTDTTGPKHINLKLHRTQFETLTSPLIQHTIVNPCRKALLDARVKPSEVNEVILVGGMTCMLKVGKGVNPDEAIAIATAIQGGLQVFSTAADSQTAIEVKIFQGERELVEDNKLLGNFNLVGIPLAPKGIPQIENTLDINADDIVYVTAQGKATSEDQSMMITSSLGLSNKDIKHMISDAKKYTNTDKAHQELIEEANKAMNKFKDQLDAAKSNASVTAEQIKEKISEIQQALLGLFQKVYEKRSTENASSKESMQGSEEKKDPFHTIYDIRFLDKMTSDNLGIKGALGCLKEGHTTIKENAFLGSCTCSIQSIVIPILLLANLYFLTTTNLDVGNIAAQLGKMLLEFGLVIFACQGVCKNSTDLFSACLNDILGNLTVKENGVLLVMEMELDKPRRSGLAFSSLTSSSSVKMVPPVRMARPSRMDFHYHQIWDLGNYDLQLTMKFTESVSSECFTIGIHGCTG
ncbi:Hsp70 protein-domain-containing protein [Pisolithus tinctorius]|nr:Hsp70 protein-domain-containing protein [Pisolithus tinctorius]